LKSVKEIELEIVKEFEIFDSWMDRYEYIIDLGKQLPVFPDQWKIDQHRVIGCQSQVWFKTELQDNLFICQAISDSAIVSGLIALLLRIYNEQNPADIVQTTPSFISMIGLDEHLSPTRNNGLNIMLQRIKNDANNMVTGQKIKTEVN
jgi:cysteine desulfuration protein SufE